MLSFLASCAGGKHDLHPSIFVGGVPCALTFSMAFICSFSDIIALTIWRIFGHSRLEHGFRESQRQIEGKLQ